MNELQVVQTELEKKMLSERLYFTGYNDTGKKARFTVVMDEEMQKKKVKEIMALVTTDEDKREQLKSLVSGDFDAIKLDKQYEFDIPGTVEEMIMCENGEGYHHLQDICTLYKLFGGPISKYEFDSMLFMERFQTAHPNALIKKSIYHQIGIGVRFSTGILLTLRKTYEIEQKTLKRRKENNIPENVPIQDPRSRFKITLVK